MNNQQTNTQKSRSLGYNRFDQERYSAKDETGGFSIDTKLTYQPNGGGISLTPNPNSPAHVTNSSLDAKQNTAPFNKSSSYFQSSQLTQAKTISNVSTNAGNLSSSTQSKYTTSSTVPSLQKRSHSNPIIIIPNTRTSLIQMINALDILQELKYFQFSYLIVILS